VEYSDDGGTTWNDLGHIRADGSEDGTEAQSAETAAGFDLYAGTAAEYTVMVTDWSLLAALKTLQKDDTKQGTMQLRFTDAEGNVSPVEEGFGVIVQENKQFQVGNRNAFT